MSEHATVSVPMVSGGTPNTQDASGVESASPMISKLMTCRSLSRTERMQATLRERRHRRADVGAGGGEDETLVAPHRERFPAG